MGRRLAAIALVVGLAGLAAGRAQAQDPFRIAYEVDRSSSTKIRLTGRVVNDARLDAVDVYVTAEALDAGGKVVARGVTFVASSISQGGSAPFVANVPVVPGITRFRVIVSSYRFGLGSQGP